jgi:hypothetical protein
MGQPAPQRQNIFDLTAHESAWLGLPHAELLIKAFRAIKKKKLAANFNETSSAAVHLATKAIPPLENDPHFFVRWFRSVMVDLADYRHWRQVTCKERESAETRPPPRASLQKVHDGIKRYLENEQAEGRSGSQKRAWQFAKAVMPGATYTQVIEAYEADGGKKRKGRPRVQTGSKGAC